jgi:hypothetical protein
MPPEASPLNEFTFASYDYEVAAKVATRYPTRPNEREPGSEAAR